MKSAEVFSKKLRRESQDKTTDLLTLEVLKNRSQTVFSVAEENMGLMLIPDFKNLVEMENNPVLAEIIIGKEHVDIAAMIKKLGNSDWVRQGLSFHRNNENQCPFCQQTTYEGFKNSLAEYFDESYTQDLKTIKT